VLPRRNVTAAIRLSHQPAAIIRSPSTRRAAVPRPEGPILDLVTTRCDDAVVVVVTGELDCATAPACREALEAAVSEPRQRLVIDITGLTFVDPSGVRPLVEVWHNPEARPVCLRGASDRIARVFTLLELREMLRD
jgi:anti-sigma B factor antagonist